MDGLGMDLERAHFSQWLRPADYAITNSAHESDIRRSEDA